MKKFGSNRSILLSLLLVLACFLSAQGQNTLCKDNLGKDAPLYIEAPLRDVFYVNYSSVFIDSSLYIIAKTIDTNSVESTVSKMNQVVFGQGSKIKFVRRISFEKNLKKYSIVKYSILKADGTEEKKIVQLLAADTGWSDIGLSLNDEIVFVLDTLNSQGFWCFYSSDAQESCAAINGLKSKAKNFDGTLNMNKLADVVKQNLSSLKSYID